jgi:hypothetical protein
MQQDAADKHVIDGLARGGYNAYGTNRCWMNYDGTPMQNWSDTSPSIQEGWRAAASAIRASIYASGIPQTPESLSSNAMEH